MTFWHPERVEGMRPEYIFNVPKKYQREEGIEGAGLDEGSPMQLGLGWTISLEEMQDSESAQGDASEKMTHESDSEWESTILEGGSESGGEGS